MKKRAEWIVLALGSLLCVPAFGQSGAAEERGSTESAFEEREGMNVAQQARLAFGSADRKMVQADKLDEKIAEESDAKKREKLVEKRDKAYASAVDSYREGLAYEQDATDAWAGLGRAYREIGKYQESLLAYAEGMRREGAGTTNLLGWTRTLMDGKMFGNATAAYAQFAAADTGKAAAMLDQMESWLGERRQNPADIDPADLERLGQWIAAQRQ